MSILNLTAKNPSRGYGLLRGATPLDPVWNIVVTDGLRFVIEAKILDTLNAVRQSGTPLLVNMSDAMAADIRIIDILNILYDVEATNSCVVAEMMIHRPVVLDPVMDQSLARADFSIQLADYQSGLYYTGPHTKTDWEVSQHENMTYPDFSSYNDSGNLTDILTSDLIEHTVYYIRAKFQSHQMNSLWSQKVRVTTGFIRAFKVRVVDLTLFCTSLVNLRAKVLGGDPAQHTLEWEQITNQPITWNFGQVGALHGQYVSGNFSDVFWNLVIDRSTPYEQRVRLNVFRGGVEFAHTMAKRYSTHPRTTVPPQLRLVKGFYDQEINYTKENGRLHLFWENPDDLDMRIQVWDSSLFRWVQVADGDPPRRLLIQPGMFRIVVQNLGVEPDLTSRVAQIGGDDDLHFNDWFLNSTNILHTKQVSNLIVNNLTSIQKEMLEVLAVTAKLSVSRPLSLSSLRLTIISKELQEDARVALKLHTTGPIGLTVVLSEHTEIGTL